MTDRIRRQVLKGSLDAPLVPAMRHGPELPGAKNDGAMRKAFADDGVHPNASGYAAMERVLLPVLPSRLHDGS